MNLPTALFTIRWMVRDTIRQSLASRVFWVMAVISSVCIALCLSVGLAHTPLLPSTPSDIDVRLPPRVATEQGGVKSGDGVDVIKGKVTVLFGAFPVEFEDYPEANLQFLQIMLAGVIADTAGLLLALVWTAGFLPTFLEANAVTVLLAKPVPRWSLLVGKYIGVVVFVALQVAFFVFGTWAVLGIKTGYWNPNYLLCIPVLVTHFAIFFSFSLLLAVCTRSTVVCVVGSVVFWLVCWAMNYGRMALIAYEPAGLTSLTNLLVEAGYWILPKPADIGYLLMDVMQADKHVGRLPEFQTAQANGRFAPDLSLFASLLFALGTLALAAYEFATAEY